MNGFNMHKFLNNKNIFKTHSEKEVHCNFSDTKKNHEYRLLTRNCQGM